MDVIHPRPDARGASAPNKEAINGNGSVDGGGNEEWFYGNTGWFFNQTHAG